MNQSSKVKLFLTDVDGVLTDGGMYYTENGDELKKFCVYDGMGLQIIQNSGIKTGIITSENRALNQRRAGKLGLNFVYQGVKDKLKLVNELCEKLDISLKEVAYVGDDINDLDLLQNVGWPACPANAMESIKSVPNIKQLETEGGKGAVREYINYLIKNQLLNDSNT